MVSALLDKGWAHFPAESDVLDWAGEAYAAALPSITDPDQQRQWLNCQGTWFVGVDALPNGPNGAVAGSGPVSGAAVDQAILLYGQIPLHRAQVSVVYPGYPKPREGEGDAAFRYRLNRDAAHVDGLLAMGDNRRRKLIERHAYILGLPLTHCNAEASPLVVWEGSHHIMRAAFQQALGHVPHTDWAAVDLTDNYQSARRKVFASCPRLIVPAKPGEATLVHRHTLHGVAPWGKDAQAPDTGRMIAYFRPELPAGTDAWLTAP